MDKIRINCSTRDPEVMQFFELLTIQTRMFGFDKEQVVDAMQSLDSLYAKRLQEAGKKENLKTGPLLERIETIQAELDRKKHELEQMRYADDRIYRMDPPQVNALSQMLPELYKSLKRTIDRVETEAMKICEDAEQRASAIREKSRSEMKKELQDHKQIMEGMKLLKKQYLSDLVSMQRILSSLGDETAHLKEQVESVMEEKLVLYEGQI